MATYTLNGDNLPLSGSTAGQPILISGTATGGSVVIHTDPNTANQADAVALKVANSSASAVMITLEIGTATSTVNHQYSCPANSITQIPGRFAINGGTVIKAWAGTANVLSVTGQVRRQTSA